MTKKKKKIELLPIDKDTYKIMKEVYKKEKFIPYNISKPYDEYDFLKILSEKKVKKNGKKEKRD